MRHLAGIDARKPPELPARRAVGDGNVQIRGTGVSARAAFVLAIASCLAACASDPPTVAELCQNYQDAYCAKSLECAASSDRADLAEACDFLWQVYSVCDRVANVTPRYSLCIEAIHGISCTNVESGSVPEFPNDCQGIFVGKQ